MKIGLIGGTLESLLLALELQKEEHQIHIFEIEAEIGLPVQYPGYVENMTLFSEYFTEEQQRFLTLCSNPIGWAFRTEWVVKFLAHQAVALGVHCLPRTRILGCQSSPDGVEIQLSSNERDFPSNLHVDLLIDFTYPSASKPGHLEHRVPSECALPYTTDSSTPWFGGLVLQSDLMEGTNALLELRRSDGVAELWWPTKPGWVPQHGFLETYEASLQERPEQLSFDAAVRRARSFVAHVV